jgi:hypothetical protein
MLRELVAIAILAGTSASVLAEEAEPTPESTEEARERPAATVPT